MWLSTKDTLFDLFWQKSGFTAWQFSFTAAVTASATFLKYLMQHKQKGNSGNALKIAQTLGKKNYKTFCNSLFIFLNEF